MDRRRTHSGHVICFMQRKHTLITMFARNKESDLDTLHITHFQCGLQFISKKESKPFLVVRFGFGPSQSKRSLSEAHCDRQKSLSYNMTLPFMTSEYLRLLHRGEYSSHNDNVTKNKEIYSSLTTVNYCQE